MPLSSLNLLRETLENLRKPKKPGQGKAPGSSREENPGAMPFL